MIEHTFSEFWNEHFGCPLCSFLFFITSSGCLCDTCIRYDILDELILLFIYLIVIAIIKRLLAIGNI